MTAYEPPKDHVDDGGAESGFDENIRSKDTWLRLVFMLIMGLLLWIGMIVGICVVVLQFFWVLFTGETKKELSAVGRQLGEYAREVFLYMTYNTEERPFPFDRDWPGG